MRRIAHAIAKLPEPREQSASVPVGIFKSDTIS